MGMLQNAFGLSQTTRTHKPTSTTHPRTPTTQVPCLPFTAVFVSFLPYVVPSTHRIDAICSGHVLAILLFLGHIWGLWLKTLV